MYTKVLIIDGQRDFRRLLTHHVGAHWPDAVISDYDPESTGNLPEGFSGAGNDLILLGSRQGQADGLAVLRQFMRVPNFPPVIYFGEDDNVTRSAAKRAGAAGCLPRNGFRHSALTVMLGDAVRTRQNPSSTSTLFVGDLRTGIHPLIRGYELRRRISSNAHSGVYLARRNSDGLDVILKVLRSDPEKSDGLGAFDRFLQEYELIADVRHPNVVRIYDLGVSDEHAHIAMEYLSGGDLKQRILHGVRSDRAIEYARQIGSALVAIHKVGILHRDLKPANIMLRDDDSVALIDFGLAKQMRLTETITDSGEIFGTPYYMSPEQGHGDDVDERSDIYSLGVILYELLTGSKPFTADNAMGIIYKHSESPIPRLPKELAAYQALLDRMLAKDPGDRFQSAEELCACL